MAAREPTRLDVMGALAELMAKHGLTRVQVDGIQIERPLAAPLAEKPPEKPEEEETDEDRIARMSPEQIDAAFHAAKLNGLR